jgi:hypothetical protein
MAQQLPRATLYTNPGRAPTHECETCVSNGAERIATVRSEFGPVLCHRHRDNTSPPTVGWAYITKREAKVINILRDFTWTESADLELSERAHQVEMERMNGRFAEIGVVDGSTALVASPPRSNESADFEGYDSDEE